MENAPKKALGFLTELLKSQNINQKELAERIGVTPQRVSWIFKKADDCSLGRAQDIAKAAGYGLKVDLIPSEEKKRPKKEKISLGDYKYGDVNIKIKGLVLVDRTAPQPVVIADCVKDCTEDRRLWFLANFIKRENVMLNQVTENIGVSKSYLYFSFKTDDIPVSVIYRIAAAYGQDVVWSLEKL